MAKDSRASAKKPVKAMPKADNGKGFKKVPKGEEKGKKPFVPPWMKDKKKK